MFWRMAGLSTASPVSAPRFSLFKVEYLRCLLDPILLACCFLNVGFHFAWWFAFLGLLVETKWGSWWWRLRWSFAWSHILLANVLWSSYCMDFSWLVGIKWILLSNSILPAICLGRFNICWVECHTCCYCVVYVDWHWISFVRLLECFQRYLHADCFVFLVRRGIQCLLDLYPIWFRNEFSYELLQSGSRKSGQWSESESSF